MPASRILITIALACVLAFALAGCSSSGDTPSSGSEDTTGSASPVNGDDSVADLEGGLVSREKLVDGFPEDVPLPTGTLVLSTVESVEGREVLVAEITNSAEIDSADAASWYEAKLYNAGFSNVAGTVAIHNIVRGNKVYDARIDATGPDGRAITVYLGPNDYNPGLRFWVDVDATAE